MIATSSLDFYWHSQTSGSILEPSSFNNLVGIKPTVGLTSRSLVIPISEHQDTVGPMARTVKDAAYVLQAIAGKDPYDNYTSAIPCTPLPDYVAACKLSSLKGKRIGVPRDYLNFAGPGTKSLFSAFEAAIEVIKKAGATIVDNTNVSAYALDQLSNGNSSTLVVEADFFTNLPQYLSQLTTNPQKVYSLADLRNFTRTFPAEDYPDRDTRAFDNAIALGFNNTSPKFWTAYQTNLETSGLRGILGLLANFTLDALIQPTDFSFQLPALGGLPVVTVPLGFFPYDNPVVKGERGTLVQSGPNIP